MQNNVRPADMERITNFELANAFIDEQIKEIRAQVAIRRCCWHCPAAWIPVLWLPC